jgi:hypothetical protein
MRIGMSKEVFGRGRVAKRHFVPAFGGKTRDPVIDNVIEIEMPGIIQGKVAGNDEIIPFKARPQPVRLSAEGYAEQLPRHKGHGGGLGDPARKNHQDPQERSFSNPHFDRVHKESGKQKHQQTFSYPQKNS